MKSLDFIYNRKSVRKFKADKVVKEDIVKMLDAAVHAPSPKNQQTWHFVVIQNSELINKISDIVTKNHTKLADMAKEEKQRKLMMNLLSYYTCFKNAPVLVVVYSKEYYMVEETILKDNNASEEVLNELRFPNSAAQGIGAAVENFLLAATELGYGTCYMTGPTHSKVEIEELINFEKEEYKLMSMIALGVAEDDIPNSPPRKPLEDVAAATLWISAAIGMTCGVGMYDVAIITTVASVAVLTLIRIFERKILPVSIKRNRRYKVVVYCNNNEVEKIHDYLTTTVENIEDFSAKKLLENPEKTKISVKFELSDKKLMKSMYSKITEICTADSVSLQEFND